MNKKTVRVLHIGADNIGYGGRSVIAYRLTQHMSSKIQNDFLIFKQIDEFYEDKLRLKNGKTVLIDELPDKRKRIRYEWKRSKKIIGKMRENQYDIVHIHSDNAYESLKSALLAKLAGVKYIFVHAHSAGNGKQNNIALKIIISISRKIVLRIINETFACSIEAAQYLFGNLSDNVHIIKNGIDIEQYLFKESMRVEKRKELHLENNYIIGCVARLSPEKNHIFLIDIFKEVARMRQDAVLVLIGEGKCKKIIEEKVIENGLYDRVRLLGNRKDVSELLQAMDVFVLTSYYEGFGIVNIEAQASGLPCVVSEGIPETAKVLDSFYRVSLGKTAKRWADIICGIEKTNRIVSVRGFKERGFDIAENALYLENIYREYGIKE